MLSNLVALLSSRVFVGYPLNRNEIWVRTDPSLSNCSLTEKCLKLRATLGYTLDGFTGGSAKVSSRPSCDVPSAVIAIAPEA